MTLTILLNQEENSCSYDTETRETIIRLQSNPEPLLSYYLSHEYSHYLLFLSGNYKADDPDSDEDLADKLAQPLFESIYDTTNLPKGHHTIPRNNTTLPPRNQESLPQGNQDPM